MVAECRHDVSHVGNKDVAGRIRAVASRRWTDGREISGTGTCTCTCTIVLHYQVLVLDLSAPATVCIIHHTQFVFGAQQGATGSTKVKFLCKDSTTDYVIFQYRYQWRVFFFQSCLQHSLNLPYLHDRLYEVRYLELFS